MTLPNQVLQHDWPHAREMQEYRAWLEAEKSGNRKEADRLMAEWTKRCRELAMEDGGE